MLKKLVGIAVALLLLYYIVTRPAPAADFVETSMDNIGGWAEGIADFFGQITD